MQKSANLLEIKDKSIFVSARSLYRGQKFNASKLPSDFAQPAQAAGLKHDMGEGAYVAK